LVEKRENEQQSLSPAGHSGSFEESQQMAVETGTKVEAPPIHQLSPGVAREGIVDSKNFRQ